MILGYFLFGALVDAAIMSISDTDDEEEENKDEQSN